MNTDQIAKAHDAVVLVDKDGDVAIQQRRYDEGVIQIRFRPDPCDYLPVERWNSMTEAEIAAAIC